MPLTLTDDAAEAVRDLISSTPDVNGVRITSKQFEGQTVYELIGVELPVAGDAVVEEHGARVFIEPTIAEALDESILDARTGADATVSFMLIAA